MKLLCSYCASTFQIPGAGEHQGPHTTAGFEGFYSENHQPNRKLKNAGRKSDYMWSSPGEPQKVMTSKSLWKRKIFYDAGLE